MIKMIITTKMRDEAPTRLQPSINASGTTPSSCPVDVSPVTDIVVCSVTPSDVVSFGWLLDCVPNGGRAGFKVRTYQVECV